MAKALELFHNDRFRANEESFNITPTEAELKESGYFSQAVSELMYSPETKHEQYLSHEAETENFADFQFNVEQGLEKGTTVTGGRGCGKTNTAKQIVKRLQDHGCVVRVYDNSQAWGESSFKNLVKIMPNSNFEPVYSESYVFDISLLSIEDQKDFIETQIANDYYKAVAQSEAERTWRVYVFEEAELPMGKKRSPTMLQFCSIGRNFKLSFVAVAQRFQMLNTDLISLSGQLYVGAMHEDNDLKKLRNWLKDKTEDLKHLELGDFVRYCDGETVKMHCDKFTDNTQHAIVEAEPLNTPQPITQSQNTDYTAFLKLLFLSAIAIVFLWSVL